MIFYNLAVIRHR